MLKEQVCAGQWTHEIAFDLCILQRDAVGVESLTVKEGEVVNDGIVKRDLSFLDLKYLLGEQHVAERLSVENSIGLERMNRRAFVRIVVEYKVEERCQMFRVDIQVVNIIEYVASWRAILPLCYVAQIFTCADKHR